MPICRTCGNELIEGENWYPSFKKNWINNCIPCEIIRVDKYRLEHKSEINKYARNRRRTSIIGTIDDDGNRIDIKCKKRLYTEICELCGKEMNCPSYHHWDNENPSNGMWVCQSCHMCVEKIENIPNIKELYENLKSEIERGIK